MRSAEVGARGPYDSESYPKELDDLPGMVDLGSLRLPVPLGGIVSVEPPQAGRINAVHVTLPAGRLSASALAAPRTRGMWPGLANEIATSLREGGARGRSVTGAWGRELHAVTSGATSVF